MSEESGSRYKAQLLALSEGQVLVRKARKFELPISIRLNDRRGGQIDPPSPRPDRVKINVLQLLGLM